MFEGFVQFAHTVARDIDIKVTWYGEHPNLFAGRINGYYNIGLRQVDS